ncbi:MAG: DUF2079 domain-containing protein [Candidatus Dormibacteraceae bacterium]
MVRRTVELVVRRQGLIALCLGAVYSLVFIWLSVLRHQSYHSFGFDLGLFDQVIWNTTQGRLFESTMAQAVAVPHSQLGDHFSPAMLLLVPFYLVFPHPETLLVIQTLALALGAWPVYLLAKLKLAPGYAPLWVLAYFLFIPLAYINLNDFHEITLAVAPLGFALYFLESGRRGWFLLSLLFTFLVKEEMALVAVGFGAYALLGKRDWKVGLGVMVGSVIAFAALIQVVIPFFSGGHAYPYVSYRYTEVGGGPRGILTTLVTDPLRIVRAVVQPKKVSFLVAIFGSTLGLSALAGWASLLLLPTLAYSLLSSYTPQFSFTTQYSAPLIPLVIGTAILALSRLRESAKRPLMAAVVVSSLVFSWAFGDMPFSRKFDPSQFTPQSRYALFVRELVRIAPDARVSAENGFPSHLAERRYIYDYQFEGVQDAEWVVLDYEGVNYSTSAFDKQVADVQAAGYGKVATGYGLALLHKR